MIPMWCVPKTQPKKAVWTTNHLCAQHAEYFSKCLDLSSKSTYDLGFNSYLSFCYWHKINLDPTLNTLSWFIAYMAQQTGPLDHLISIQTISSYLLGISHDLQPFYPHVLDSHRHSDLVSWLSLMISQSFNSKNSFCIEQLSSVQIQASKVISSNCPPIKLISIFMGAPLLSKYGHWR